MRALNRDPAAPRNRLRAVMLVAALLVCGCTTPGARQSAHVQVEKDSGLTITETVRVSGDVRNDFQRAVELLANAEYEDGIALLLQVTEDAPYLTTAHVDLGMAYSRFGDLERAEASLKRALELTARHPVAHNELGIVYRKTGRFEQARDSYEAALEVYPSFHPARRNLAILCDLYLGDVKCALENYQLYSQAIPEDETVAMWIADLQNRIEE